ncbi:MAG: helix-turn-helix domain-containing protein [Spirochaetaceae bacterium]|nr:helix-turn-helix domain-containing protein [Myxococcales bacterium]MCB9724419.1 helix-turn-helix domain-containing protein [Spirochaetaceae bacterium]
MDPGERWVGVDDVAAHLGVGKDSIYRWVENRGLPARKVGRLLRFKLSEVDAWVEAGGGEGGRPAAPQVSTSTARSKKGRRR